MTCSILGGVLVLFLVADFSVGSKRVAKNVDSYPEIIDFPEVDLLSAGDVNQGETLKLPCRARGAKPLHHKWYRNKKEIDVYSKSSSCGLDKEGSLVCRNINYESHDPQSYQCYVSNSYGTVFSREVKVDVTAILAPFGSGPSRKATTVTYFTNSPWLVNCPHHRTHLAVNYTWVYQNSTSGQFIPLPDSRFHSLLSTGDLKIISAKRRELSRPLHCKISAGSTSYISSYYEFVEDKSSYTAPFAPSLSQWLPGSTKVFRGQTQVMRCIPSGDPISRISWWKDGEFIVSGRNNIKLKSINRILVIKNANEKQHPGTYECGIADQNEKMKKSLSKTKLVVKGPPVIIHPPPKALTVWEGKSFSLYCDGKVPSDEPNRPSAIGYTWYKDGKELMFKWKKVVFGRTLQNLTVSRLDFKDSGVYQCRVLGLHGIATVATRVHVKVVTCDAIAPPAYARFTANDCRLDSHFLPGKACTWSCRRGFLGIGPRDYTECQNDGKWLTIKYKCEDIEVPRLKKGHGCPNSITIPTKRHDDRGSEVSWIPPIGLDNSGQVDTKVQPPGINGKADWFQLGLHPIKYTFIDPAGHSVTCQFNITIFPRTTILTKPPRRITILKNEPLELKCIANSDPTLQYTWKKSSLTKPNKMVDISKHSHLQVLDGGKRLVIRRVKYYDSGKYSCEVINRLYNVSGARDAIEITLEVAKAVEWSPWKPWSSCKGNQCGYKGHKTRRRECLKANSTQLARGCVGVANQKKSCIVTCSTLVPDVTTSPPTDKSLFGISIKKVISNYNGWLKSHHPKIFNFLNTSTGKIAFSCALAAAGISIVLICWSCSHYISRRRMRKKMVKFSDEDYMASEIEPLQGEEEGQLVDHKPQQIMNQNLQEPIFDTQQMGYYDGDYQGDAYPEGYTYYYEDDGYEEGEIVYEMTG